MADLDCDVAVRGAGTAGLAAERAARKAGAATLLIDEHFSGTTCAAVGCMPSKLLIAAADAAHRVRQASIFGVVAEMKHIDGASVMRRLQKERDAFVAATKKSIDDIPAGICIKQRATFVDPTTLALTDGRRVSARAIVVATGAKPSIPKMFHGLDGYIHTNETIFELATLPRSLAVIGAGPLGLELAQAFARLGVATAVFEKGDHIAALRDPDIAGELNKILAADFPIHLNVDLHAEKAGDGVRLSWTGSSAGDRVFDYILVAAGRPPNLAGLDIAKAGLALGEHGTPTCDSATQQCGAAPIFLAGDVDGARPVLHEASADGAIAGRNAAAFPNVKKTERSTSLSIMFTDPPLAVIGDPPTSNSLVGTASYANQGRAKVDAQNNGLIKIFAEHAEGRISGAILLGPGMDHTAHLLAWAIARNETAAQLLQLPFYHPTTDEGLKPALRQICERVDRPSLADLDDGAAPGA
jgi:dihydrolipoamide dehydrogenase